MLIQVALIIILLLLAINFIRSRTSTRTRAYKKLALLIFVLLSIVVVIFPSLTTDVAHFLGVGRGADLLLYGLAVVVIFKLLNDYMKDREKEKVIVILSRKIAILEAKERNRSRKK